MPRGAAKKFAPKGPYPNEVPKVAPRFQGAIRERQPALPVFRGGSTGAGRSADHPYTGRKTTNPRGFSLFDFDFRGLRRIRRHP